jgi:glycosyltransferase involved in cell wall biosynthesis
LKICQVIDLVNVGGAGIAAKRISNVLSNHYGHDLVEISSSPSKSNSLNYTLQNSRKLQLISLFPRFSRNHYFKKFWSIDINQQFKRILEIEKPNIINFHNIHSASWSIDLVKTALNFAPVLWTLHDCWSFYGSYYPSHCSDPTSSLSEEVKDFWAALKYSPSSYALSAVTPSNWMSEQASSSHWKDHQVCTIRNPVPNSFFECLDREACKKALGLSLNKPTVLCIAGNLNEKRKGGPILKEILESDAKDQCQFLLIGEGNQFNDPKIKSLGYVQDEITLRIAYHAADVLLHPAQVDNLPNTVAESMSCGTPVIAFNTGGLPEMVIPEKSGWLVEEMSSNAMIKKLKSVAQSKQAYELTQSTKETAHKLFNEDKVADNYIECFNHSLSK